MEKLLLLFAVLFAVLAISSRHRMHKSVEEAQSQTESVDTSLKGDDQNPQSLTYALTKMTSPPNPRGVIPPPPPPSALKPAAKGLPPTALSHDDLVKEIQKQVLAIQLSNEDSPYAFEKALNLTSDPADLALRLTVFQAALNMQVDSLLARNIAVRETTNLLVAPGLNPDSPTPEEAALRDTQRNIVTNAYKVYLQYNQDPETVLNDAQQALNFQTDLWVRRQIIFESVSKFPQLREKLNE
jgi:hypothetical protein